MSRKRPDFPTKIIGSRYPVALEQRVLVVAKELSTRASGVPVTLSAAMNIIVARGLDSFEVEFGIAKAKSPRPTKSTKAA